METSHDPLEVALDALSKGIVPVPCHLRTKVPMVRWKQWQQHLPPEHLVREWFRSRCNIAVICRGLVLFDCDDMASAERVLSNCGDTPHQLKTPRGIHLGYRRRRGIAVSNKVKIHGWNMDVRTDGGLEMIPPSETEHGHYEWLGTRLRSFTELPVAKVGWTRERTRRAVNVLVIDEGDSAVRRARKYITHIEGAVSGERGHDRTFRAACVLVQKFGLSFEQALPLLKEWSDCSCEPPWSDAELTHKLCDAIRRRSG